MSHVTSVLSYLMFESRRHQWPTRGAKNLYFSYYYGDVCPALFSPRIRVTSNEFFGRDERRYDGGGVRNIAVSLLYEKCVYKTKRPFASLRVLFPGPGRRNNTTRMTFQLSSTFPLS